MKLFIKSFIYAASGAWFCLRHERNFRIHLVVAAYVLGFAPAFSLTRTEWALLIITISAVLAAEAVTTAVEHTVDISSPNIHPAARIAKDAAAAAVLICSIASVGVGFLMFGDLDKLAALWNNLVSSWWKLTVTGLSLVVSFIFILRGGPHKNIPTK